MSGVVRVLRLDLRREYLLADDADAQLETLRHVRLKNDRAESHRLGIRDVAARDDLGVPTERGAQAKHEGGANELADDLPVVLAVEVEKVGRAIGDQRGRKLESQSAGHGQLRRLLLRSLHHRWSSRQPCAVQEAPRILGERPAFLLDICPRRRIFDLRIGNW